jgi:sialate O-acetylesterase
MRILIFVLCLAGSVLGAVRPAAVFTDNMVLQREMKVPVWGTAAPDEKVTVQFAGQTVETVADTSGNWRADLAPLETSAEPAELIVIGADSSVKLANVLVGEVWLCSGQSNMDFTMWMLKVAQEEISAATNYPLMRFFKVKNQPSPGKPATSVSGQWVESNAETAGGFSGTATYFGRALSRDLGVPVGLIHCAWGGTPAEAWTGRAALEKLSFMPDRLRESDNARENYSPEKAQAELQQKIAEWERKVAAGEKTGYKPKLWSPYTDSWQPATLYNGMIAPLVPFSIRGAIWYQGESNAGRHSEYHELFSAMIRDWRDFWGQGDFPFLYVQLANYLPVQTDPVQENAVWAFLREAQSQTLDVPNTAMAVITDIGDANDIHPKDKKTVGERLALAARAKAYGEDIVYSGPVFQCLEIKDGRAAIRFGSTGGGLVARGERLTGFAIAGEDRQWHWADAEIQGDTVVLSSPEVKIPVAVRYNWANNPVGDLYNKEGLPASLFRTDNW